MQERDLLPNGRPLDGGFDLGRPLADHALDRVPERVERV